MSLHIFNQATHHQSTLKTMLAAVSEGDAIILIEDGVYWAQAACSAPLQNLTVKTYALTPDVSARGLQSRLDGTIELVDDQGFVALCCEHSKTLSWF